MNKWVVFLVITCLVSCSSPDPKGPTVTANLLLEKTVSESSFKRALDDVGNQHNVELVLEDYIRLESSNLPAGLCASNLAQVKATGAEPAKVLDYLDEAAAQVGTTESFADIDPRYGMGQEVTPTASESGLQTLITDATGKGTRVAIFDTGFAKDETAFAAWSGSGALKLFNVTNFSSAKRNDYYDRYDQHEGLSYAYEGHGTPITVLIGANRPDFKGVAPGAEVMPIKVCDDTGQCLVSHVIQGICYALNNAPNRKLKNLILNFSLGGEQPSRTLYQALKYALDNDVSVVVSSGNRGDKDNALQYPAAWGTTLAEDDPLPNDGFAPLPGLIIVGAVEATADTFRPASFSTRASYVDIAALGVDVVSGQARAVSFGDKFSGTSFATPQIAGVMAQLRELYPDDTAVALETRLKQAAFPIEGCPDTVCTPEAVGVGILTSRSTLYPRDSVPCDEEDGFLSYGSFIRCDIPVNGENQPYTFDAKAGEKVLLSWFDRLNSESEGVCIKIRQPDGSVLPGAPTPDSECTNVGIILPAPISQTGTHSITVFTDTTTVGYGLVIERLSPPSDNALRLEYGSQTNLTAIEEVGDVDLFAITASANATVLVSIEALDEGEELNRTNQFCIELYDLAGELFPDGERCGSEGTELEATLPGTGLYSLLVRGLDFDDVFPYTVRLQCLSGPCE